MRLLRTIEFKMILAVAATTAVVSAVTAWLILSVQVRQMDEMTIRSASQLGETIKKSLRQDMLENRKQNAFRIMETIGEQEGIEKVRIYNSEGRIIFSTAKSEQGTMVDKRAEACYACHSEASPLEALETRARSRVFMGASGHRVLGMIHPMYNEPACSSEACHPPPTLHKVLGVIDVALSLEEVDKGVADARSRIAQLSLVSVLSISVILVLTLMKLVTRRIKALVLGTRKVAGGDLSYTIPDSDDDEMGYLARSFNEMTASLRKANEQILDWVRTLEQRVDEGTRELREAQSQLVRAEKLAALGQIAATVAHEINNPLTGVYTYIRLMERRVADGKAAPADVAKFREYLSTMGREVQRTSAIVSNLLEFARPKEPSRRPADLNGLVDESIAIVRNKLSSCGVDIRKDYAPLPQVLVDPPQITQVFINLIVNACEAMESGGVLTIRSRHDEEAGTEAVSFADQGRGIPAENLGSIFDPFFTTKEKGTGLGLSVAHGIVVRHGGRIEVASSSAGTTMTVVLPVA